MKRIKIKDFYIGSDDPLVVMCGPCVIESEEHCLYAADTLQRLFRKHGISLIFKSSYDKANRSSYSGFRGPGLKEGLRILQRVQQEFNLPVVTDVHSPEEAQIAGSICEIVQIPAFLCRQTDLIDAAARTSAVVSIKKGQFLAPWDMKNVVDKVHAAGGDRLLLVERGATFGYNNLVSDMRSIPWMQEFGYPVCFDATHSVQRPGGLGTKSGGDREMIPILAKSALAAGADCLFMEAHPDPANAKSDAASVLSFQELEQLLPEIHELYLLMQQQRMRRRHV